MAVRGLVVSTKLRYCGYFVTLYLEALWIISLLMMAVSSLDTSIGSKLSGRRFCDFMLCSDDFKMLARMGIGIRKILSPPWITKNDTINYNKEDELYQQKLQKNKKN